MATDINTPSQAPEATALPAEKEVEFTDFGLHPDITRAVVGMGYRVPTPIQAQAIPVVMTGVDVMGAAQTGTGKTAGFSLPILHRLMPLASHSASPARHPVRALILAPTRELADQIYVNVKEYCKHTPLRCAVVFGGVDIKPQIAQVRTGVEILIATPGRLLDHVEQKTVNLSQAGILVLDEADRMLDMGFLPDLQRIINLLPKERQSLMFSATFSEEIKRLANTFMKSPTLIEVARRNATAENVEQRVYKVVSTDAKRAAVAKIVKDENLTQVIVFSNTKIGASRLARQLERDGLQAGAIHGDKTQQERLKTLDEFKAGNIRILVATDVAARGLDIAELPAVINYDLPHAPEDYVHRIGRTGRAGASGIAISLLAPGDERYLVEIEKLIKKPLAPSDIEVEVPPRHRDDDSGSARWQEGRARPKRESSSREPSARAEAPTRASSSGAPARATSADTPEDGPRVPRRERGDAGSGRRATKPPVVGRLPGHSSDPFFFQPYEEKQDAAAAPEPAAQDAGNLPGRPVRRAKRTVAFLLGGVPKPDAGQ